MTTDQVREEVDTLRLTIAKLLREFTDRTGAVARVDIDIVDVSVYGSPKSRDCYQVRVKAELA